MELIVLSVKRSSASCRIVNDGTLTTLALEHRWDVVPGEIAVVEPANIWLPTGFRHVWGDIVARRIDPPALGLEPLRLEEQGMWHPGYEYWGKEDKPIADGAKPIIGAGSRPEFEMQQVMPGVNPDEMDDPFDDPIVEAIEWKESGHFANAYNTLMRLCLADLRCLDAHAHLGNLLFDRHPRRAIRHYKVGTQIGEWSIGKDFTGLLPWRFMNNRPFLRCMQGLGLCLWRLQRFEEAEKVFSRILWLNPSDNQGIRFLIYPVRAKKRWRSDE